MEPQEPDSDKLQPRQLWEDVAAILRREILNGRLQPGTRLMAVELAERFGVSRGPVREALRQLSRSGLVVDRMRQGVFVSTPSDTDLDEIAVYREAIEGAAVRLVIASATEEDLKRLSGTLSAMEAAYQSGDKSGGLALDLEFHREIFVLANNRRMLAAHDDLAAQLLLTATRNRALKEEVHSPEWLHRDILAALNARDTRKAVSAIRAHYTWMGDRLFGSESDAEKPAKGAGERNPAGRRRERSTSG